MIIKNQNGVEKEKMLLEDFVKERERLQSIINDYGKALISRRLPLLHVLGIYRQFSSAENIIFKSSFESYVCVPPNLLKRVRGII